jgi:spore coat polysaccharide biosynthesis protein SpsF
MTVDEEIDFQMISKLITDLGTEKSWKEYVEYMKVNRLDDYNKEIIRNEGYIKSIKND